MSGLKHQWFIISCNCVNCLGNSDLKKALPKAVFCWLIGWAWQKYPISPLGTSKNAKTEVTRSLKAWSWKLCGVISLAVCSLFLSLSLFFFGLLRATPATCRIWRFQATGQISTSAAGLHQSPATQDPSRAYNLHHSSGQGRILNPLIEARDGTWVLIAASQIRFC